MIEKIKKILRYLSIKLSLILFGQRLPLKYIFFNLIYTKIIIGNKFYDEEIVKFHKLGFVKLEVNLKKEIEKFKGKLNLNEKALKAGEKRIVFELSKKDKKEFIKEIKKKLAPTIKKLENYFKCNVFISDVLPYRIYNIKNYNSKKEIYSNFYHQDGYLKIYNKIHINLMDVGINDGPLQIVPKESRKFFIKKFKYKERNSYDFTTDQDFIYKNTGKIGECCLFSSSEVMHKAGIPDYHRDMLQLILITYPKNIYEKLFYNNDEKIFHPYNDNIIQKIARPNNLIKVFKNLIIILKNKNSFI